MTGEKAKKEIELEDEPDEEALKMKTSKKS
jgi:hypothetical protein